mgnify:CR=1 FL=1
MKPFSIVNFSDCINYDGDLPPHHDIITSNIYAEYIFLDDIILKKFQEQNDKMIENITERHPLKKYLKPEEVAGMAEYLLSEKASSISPIDSAKKS